MLLMNKDGHNLGFQLIASFFGVILLGLLGYFHTVAVLQSGEMTNRQINETVGSCLLLAKDAALASERRPQGRPSEEAVQKTLARLRATLNDLPHNAALDKRLDEVERRNGPKAGSPRLLEASISRLVTDLREYQAQSETVEAGSEYAAVLGGWGIQAVLVFVSLLVAYRMLRLTSAGIEHLRQAEDTARRSSEMLQLIMDNIPQRIYWKDTRSVYLGGNDNFARSVGLSASEELAGKTAQDFPQSQEEADRLSVAEQQVMEADRPDYRCVESLLQTGGGQSWTQTSRIPLHDAQNCVVGILCTVEDITEQKQAEEALRQTETRLSTAIANIPVIVFALDGAGRFTYCEGKGLAALALSPEQVVGRFCQDVYRDTPVLLEHLHLALTGVPHAWTVEVRGRIHETQAMPLRGPAGELTGVVGAAYDVTEHKRLEEQLSHQAFHDALTGLPNRALFRDRLEHALTRARRRCASVAVLFIDLDNFKVVNDSLGHQTGDVLLMTAAERLNRSLRDGDTLARMGGDEFTILLEDVTDPEMAAQIAERIAETLREPLNLSGHSLFLTASIGMAMTDALKTEALKDAAIDISPADEAECLLRDADIAMYQAKSGGKANYVVFHHQMIVPVMERMEMEMALRRVLDADGHADGELVVHYQPIVSMDTGAVCEIEALVRWNHPTRGLLPPSEFIPLAEDTGLIVPLGWWVLRQACLEAKRLEAEFPSSQPLILGVNLSVRQLEQPNLTTMVAGILQETGLAPQNLKLEITESVMMERSETIIGKLRALRAMGVKLAIDDFGTGYSSMACLSDFPLDTLKIDRAFIEKMSDPDGMAIVQAIVMLAQVLHLEVTCEGIETAAQWEQLQTLSCDRGQGYFFARPQTSEALSAILSDANSPQIAAPSANAVSAA